MARRDRIHVSLVAALCALALLVLAVVAGLTSDPPAGQEQFETVSDPARYAALLAATGPGLRVVLFVDTLFLMAYTVAIGFADLAFCDNNRAAAWFAGIGIVAVMLLDAVENATMVQSLDLVEAGAAITAERIAGQALVSAVKWQGAAVTLLAMSFVLPNETGIEKLLVWGLRLGLPIAVPLFLMDAFGLREVGGLLLLVSMAVGFVLLVIVLRRHAATA